jgi:cell wall-associated protease
VITACAAATLSPSLPSPQAAATQVVLTGSASGCPNPLYQFWILAPQATSWTIVQAYSAVATFNWNTTGLTAGSYLYTVWVRDASSKGTACSALGCSDAYSPATAYVLVTTPCTAVTDTAAPLATAPAGAAVTFTGAASGCPKPLYQFWLLAPGSTAWTIGQAYSSSAIFNWNTGGLHAGTYAYTVWVRDSSSPGTNRNNLGSFDAFFPASSYTLTPTACPSVTESVAPTASAPSGTTLTFTASASGCSNPRYQFWTLAPGSTTWTIGQAYSASATFAWNTTGLPAGTYRYTVWVRDAGSVSTNGNNLGSFDSYFPVATYALTTTPCASVTESAAPVSTAASGTTVTFTAGASGCPNPLYQFWILAPSSSRWTIAQPYSSSTTLSWNTTGKPAGAYLYTVWVRDASSAGTTGNNLGSFDAFFPATVYTLTSTPCASVSESAAPVSTEASGTTVTFTASASGCPNAVYQFWMLAPGSTTWTVVQSYSSNATFTWVTTGKPAGAYRYTVWVRDASSAGTNSNNLGSFDAYFPSTAYTLT